MITQEDIENWFSYHSPTDAQIEDYGVVRNEAKLFAETLNRTLTDCADKTAVFRKLRELVMAANQTIACNPANVSHAGDIDSQSTNQ